MTGTDGRRRIAIAWRDGQRSGTCRQSRRAEKQEQSRQSGTKLLASGEGLAVVVHN